MAWCTSRSGGEKSQKGRLWVKSGTVATVFNLQTGAKKKAPHASVPFQGAIVADAPSSLCLQKRQLPTQRSSRWLEKREKRHRGTRTQAGTQKAEDILSPEAVLH